MRPSLYSAAISFCLTLSSSPSNSSLADSRQAPKWYSSKMTKSQFVVCTHSFFDLMSPVFRSRPRRSWKDPKYTSGRVLSASSGLPPVADERYCQPSKSACDSRSLCHASSTAGLNVTTSTRLAPRRLASWYEAKVLPNRIFAFHRNLGTALVSSAQIDSK